MATSTERKKKIWHGIKTILVGGAIAAATLAIIAVADVGLSIEFLKVSLLTCAGVTGVSLTGLGITQAVISVKERKKRIDEMLKTNSKYTKEAANELLVNNVDINKVDTQKQITEQVKGNGLTLQGEINAALNSLDPKELEEALKKSNAFAGMAVRCLENDGKVLDDIKKGVEDTSKTLTK